MIKFALNALNCYENHMSYIAAEISDPHVWANKPTALSGQFGVRASFDAPEHKITADNANIAATETQQESATTETDSLDLLIPEYLTLEQQIFQKLNQGLEGEAYNLIMDRLDGRDFDKVINTISNLIETFADRGFTDLANDLSQVLEALSHDMPQLEYSDLDNDAGLPTPSVMAEIGEGLEKRRQNLEQELHTPKPAITIPAPTFGMAA